MPPRPPRLRELEIFRALLHTRSVSDAARRLGVSQPAVSKALRQLETGLGFRLFERRRDGLHPTAEAEALLPALDGVFTSVAALAEAGAALREGRAAQVTVGAVPSLANTVLPMAVAATLARYPGLRIGVQVGVTQEVVTAVARGAADLGLVHDILDDPLLAVEELGGAGVACVVPRDHPFATRRMVEARDLHDVPYVSYAAHSPLSDRIAAAFGEVGEIFAPRLHAGASTTICALVEATGLPGLVEDYVPSLGWWPGLCAVPLAPPVPLRPRLLTARHRAVPAAARALAAACAAQVREMLTRQAFPLTPRRRRRGRTGAAPPPARPTSGDGGGS
jgi:DNA-binding transcriptional LysR family regulator